MSMFGQFMTFLFGTIIIGLVTIFRQYIMRKVLTTF